MVRFDMPKDVAQFIRIKNLVLRGLLDAEEAALAIEVSTSQMESWLEKYKNLSFEKGVEDTRLWPTSKRVERIKSLADEGCSVAEICRRTYSCDSFVKKHLKELGIKPNKSSN